MEDSESLPEGLLSCCTKQPGGTRGTTHFLVNFILKRETGIQIRLVTVITPRLYPARICSGSAPPPPFGTVRHRFSKRT